MLAHIHRPGSPAPSPSARLIIGITAPRSPTTVPVLISLLQARTSPRTGGLQQAPPRPYLARLWPHLMLLVLPHCCSALTRPLPPPRSEHACLPIQRGRLCSTRKPARPTCCSRRIPRRVFRRAWWVRVVRMRRVLCRGVLPQILVVRRLRAMRSRRVLVTGRVRGRVVLYRAR